MKIYELKPYGYCYGVENALKLIIEVKRNHSDKNVYVFGMLVHNNDVTNYLSNMGIISIDTNNIDKIERLNNFTSDDIVVFTAHGHAYLYEEILKKNNVTYYDATCKNVLKNLKILLDSKTRQIIYIGKKNHPETEAVLDNCSNVILYDIKDGIDYSKVTSNNPLVTNQTTLSILELSDIYDDIKSRFNEAEILDEICYSTRIRQEQLMKSNLEVDLVLIIGSVMSSNTDKLYQIAKSKFTNSKVIKIENLSELKKVNLVGFKTCLITSGTSTPLTSILEIKEYLGGLNNE